MKRLWLSLILVACIGLTTQAQLRFYYYPSTNVYYDVAQSRYIYQDNGVWTPVKVLPAKYKGVNGARYVVYNKTPDVWLVNDVHVKKYKAPKQANAPQGKAVGYKGTNPNKGAGPQKVKVSKGKS